MIKNIIWREVILVITVQWVVLPPLPGTPLPLFQKLVIYRIGARFRDTVMLRTCDSRKVLFNVRAHLPLVRESEVKWREWPWRATRLKRAIMFVLKINCWMKNNSMISRVNGKGLEKCSGATLKGNYF